MNIIYRLDFNGYYKSSLETRVKKQPFGGGGGRANAAAAAPTASPGSLPAEGLHATASGGATQLHPVPMPRGAGGGGHHHGSHHPAGSVIGPVSVKPTSKDIPEEMNNGHDH